MTRPARRPQPVRAAARATTPTAASRGTGTAGHGHGTAGSADSGRIGPVAAVLIAIVRAYQRWISPMLRPSCRFYPSCSAYAVTALARHGAARGTALAVWRLLRCHPFNPGGVDPVPERTPESTSGGPTRAKTR